MRYSLLLLLLLPAFSQAQPPPPTNATLVASGFLNPIGVATDPLGRVWVAEAGTGNDDGRISVVLPNGQVFPFLTGLRSDDGAEGPEGIAHLAWVWSEQTLYVTAGYANAEGYLHRISLPSGWDPGDPPLTPADIGVTENVGAWVLGQGYAETHPYGLAVGPDNTLYLTDSGANIVVKETPGGVYSVLASFPDLPNPSGVGPPFVDAVPTGIVFAAGRLYVSTLTGFPFPDGVANVYAVELDGSVDVMATGFTALTDLSRDPRDGALSVLRFAQFRFDPPPPGFRIGTGEVRRIADGQPLASAFSFASGMAHDDAGALYVATLIGNLYRVDAVPLPVELTAFDAVLDGTSARLAWATASETNNAGFEVQHRAPGQSVFAAVGFVEGHGTTAEPQHYAFATDALATGTHAFRLRQVDFDGVAELSEAIEVTVGVPAAFALSAAYPNPFNPSATLTLNVPEAGQATVAVFDALGRRVAVLLDGAVEAGTHTLRFEARGLPSGVYFIRAITAHGTQTHRVALLR